MATITTYSISSEPSLRTEKISTDNQWSPSEDFQLNHCTVLPQIIEKLAYLHYFGAAEEKDALCSLDQLEWWQNCSVFSFQRLPIIHNHLSLDDVR